MEKGTLVEFRLQGDRSPDGLQHRRIGVLERPEGKKNWIVIDGNGQSHTLHPRQITFTVDPQTHTQADIQPFLDEVTTIYDPSSLEVAWEILLEDKQSVSPKDMARLLYSEESAAFCYAAHCLLSEDKLYFKHKGGTYEPRSEAQVADLKHQMERESQRQKAQQAFQTALKAALAGEPVDWQACNGQRSVIDHRTYLQSLEKFAALGESASTRTAASDILASVNRPRTPEGAFQLLVDLKLWSPHENLVLHRSQIPITFSPSLLTVVSQRLENMPPDPDPTRRDLTHLKVYTIDDPGTLEIDDGLSLEQLDDGSQRVWIHIADPSRWVFPGDELDQEAQRRSTTVYLPTGMIPMFPQELSTGPMSLVQGQTCCTLSFGVTLTATGAIETYEICPSEIRPTYQLTYTDVDEMLELAIAAEPELLNLADWAKRRYEWRQAQGAIHINLPESSIKVKDEEVQITLLDDSPARQLVAEMMILAGEVAASYGQAHDLPLPFRCQPQPELPSEAELEQLPSPWVRACAIRGCMPRSEVGTTPARHASLGLESYCQVTSPIRRYSDLLAHFQIKAHLRGDPLPFDKVDLSPLIASVMTTAYEAMLIERQTNRYWSLEYLRRHADQVWQATVLRWLREHENLVLILIEDLGVELVTRLDFPVALGDSLAVTVRAVDPRLDRIKLQAYSPATDAQSDVTEAVET